METLERERERERESAHEQECEREQEIRISNDLFKWDATHPYTETSKRRRVLV